jgi:hypothetical protein
VRQSCDNYVIYLETSLGYSHHIHELRMLPCWEVGGGIMSQDRFWYELRNMGRWVILIPPLIILNFTLFGRILTIMQVGHLRISQVLTASLEMVLPLAVGLLTTTIVSYDPAIELQMTLPKTYRITAFVRLGLIIAWTSCLALFSSVLVSGLIHTLVTPGAR